MNNKTLLVGSLALLVSVQILAQENQHAKTTSSGGDVSGSSGIVSFSVGQVFYTEQESYSGSVNQGIQNAYELAVVTGSEHEQIELSVIAYPNPTKDYLNLSINEPLEKELEYLLVDVSGKIISRSELKGTETRIDMNNCASGIYFLNIKAGAETIKNFKIIKN